jgi:hypothetical protein
MMKTGASARLRHLTDLKRALSVFWSLFAKNKFLSVPIAPRLNTSQTLSNLEGQIVDRL